MRSAVFYAGFLIAVLSSQAHGQAHEYWTIPDQLDAAIEEAKALYPAKPKLGQHLPIKLGEKPPELAGLYAALDERHAPMKIHSFPKREIVPASLPTTFPPGSAEDVMVRFILKYEAGPRGYDSVWHRNKHPLPRRPTEMTICEIRDWQLQAAKIQESTPIGAFQIVGGTFRPLIQKLKLGCETLFDRKTQDRLGLTLLYERNWASFLDGTLNVKDFGFELAGEWAAFPAPYGPNKGFSRYRDIAGNRHQIELDEYLAFLTSLRDQIKSGLVSVSAGTRPVAAHTKTSENKDVLVVKID